MPKVSIIMPAYNAEKYIEDSIKSVLSQTYSNWELIIVDDYSSDNTVDIVKEYTGLDRRIKLVCQKANFGVAFSRNKGLDCADGKYVAFLDSDDLWDREKLEKQVAFMEKSKCVLTYTNYQKFNTVCTQGDKIIECPQCMRAQDVLRNTTIGCLTVMVNKDIVGQFHMPLIEHTEDNMTWYKILKNNDCKAYGISQVLAYYRTGNGSSLTQNKVKVAKKQWMTYRYYLRFGTIKSLVYFIQYAFNAVKRYV